MKIKNLEFWITGEHWFQETPKFFSFCVSVNILLANKILGLEFQIGIQSERIKATSSNFEIYFQIISNDS